MNIVEVKFDYNNTVSFFRNDKLNLKKNLTVIVDSDKGLQFGKIINIIDDVSSFEGVSLYDVVRVTSKKDYLHHLENKKMESVALKKCREIVSNTDLNMSIIDAYYNFDRSQLLFRFIADERVDFRQLAKDLGAIFHSRIELRQIGIRDKAKEVGGLGPCGRLLCCTSYLKNFDSITINMAKNQNVSLNPTKINGVCGRLLCCLKYENEYYAGVKKIMPKLGSTIDYQDKKGKVIAVDFLKKKYIIELDSKEKVEGDLNESKK